MSFTKTVYYGVGAINNGVHVVWQAAKHSGVPIKAVPTEHAAVQIVRHAA
jgi:hypothetical protein